MGVEEVPHVIAPQQKSFNQWGGEDEKWVTPFARFRVGYPSSKLKWDTNWDQFCQVAQGANDAGFVWAERSKFAPAELSHRALIKQLTQFRQPAAVGSQFSDLVESWLYSMLEPYCSGFRMLTLEEAIHGLRDQDGELEPLNMSTSPGFGFNLVYSSKEPWFKFQQKRLLDAIEWDWTKLWEGYCPLWFNKGSEKDERRDLPRVIDFKTRLFMATSIVTVVNGRRLLGDFIRKFTAAGKNLPFFSAVGMDVYGGKWDEFIRYMTANLMVTELDSTDMPKFDKEFPQENHMKDARLISALSREPEILPVLERINARAAVGPCVLAITGACFLTSKNNPSGNFDTIIKNCMTLERCVIEAWLRSDGDSTNPMDIGLGMARMRRWVRHKVLGDDLLITRSLGCPMTHEAFALASADLGWKPEREGTGAFDDSRFAGRGSVLARAGGYELFLPMVDRDRVLAVNEYRKGRHEDPVKDLTRAYAAAELAFPYLFVPEEVLFGKLYYYYMYLKHKALISNDENQVAVALGLPQIEQMWKNYTGRPCPVHDLTRLLAEQIRRAGKREAMDVVLRP